MPPNGLSFRGRLGALALMLAVAVISSCGGDGGDEEQGRGADGGSTVYCETGGLPDGTSFKVLASQQNIYTTDVTQTTDCGYMTATYVTSGGSIGPTDLVLTKLGEAGTRWTKQYTSDRNESRGGVPSTGFPLWVDLAPLEGGGAVAAFDNLIMVVDEDGAPVWSREYYHPDNLQRGTRFSSIVRVDGGFVVQSLEGGYNYVNLLKLDEDGNVVWQKEYPDLNFLVTGNRNLPVLLTADDRLLIGGWMTTAAPGKTTPDRQKAAVAAIDVEYGEVVWVSTVQMADWTEAGSDSASVSFGYQTLAIADNDDIILVQDYDPSPHAGVGGHGALITRLDPSGGHKWTKQFHYTRAGGSTAVTKIVPDGSDLVVVGYSDGFQYPPPGGTYNNMNAFVARLSEYGDLLWVRSLGRSDPSGSSFDYAEDIATSVAVTPDDRLLITGYTNSFAHRQPAWQYQDPAHYDSFIALANSEGFIRGSSVMINTPEFGDVNEVWFREPPEGMWLGTATITPHDIQTAARDVDYSATEATLQERTLPSEEGVDLKVTYRAGDRELSSNLSMFTDAAGDIDGDGLEQAWENQAIELMKPIIELDEEEDWLLHRQDHSVVHFVRVTPWPSREKPEYILMYYSVIWAADYGGGPYTQNPILTIEDHRGDVEKVVFAFKVIGDRRAKLEWVLTSAHGENTHTGVWQVSDRSCSLAVIVGKFGEDNATEIICDKLQFNSKGQLLVQASEDKHALYPSKDLCESVTLIALPGPDWGEDCGWEPSDIPAWSQFKAYVLESTLNDDPRYRGSGRWQFDAYNVGEPDIVYQLVDDLSRPETWRGLTPEQVRNLTGKYPGERVWSGAGFCGGLNTEGLNYLAYPDRCVGAPGGSLDMTPQLQDRIGNYYRLIITTSGKAGAGTDANVSVNIASASGDLTEAVIGSFERSNVDTIHMGLTDIGQIRTVSLKRDDAGEDPPWLVTKIIVERKATGERRVWSTADGIWVTTSGVSVPLVDE